MMTGDPKGEWEQGVAPRKTIGLTGGIACGKSTVARLLAARGAVIVDADQLARELVVPGSEGLAATVEAFGADVLKEDGTLNRAALGARVFGDPAALARMNALMRPRIEALAHRRLAEASQRAEVPLVVFDAALLVEWGLADRFRPLVVVVVSPEVQLARLVARDGLSAEAAAARIASQWPVAEKARVADHVLDNSGGPESLAAQVEALWQILVS
jgi:dephospho-CoA kinase